MANLVSTLPGYGRGFSLKDGEMMNQRCITIEDGDLHILAGRLDELVGNNVEGEIVGSIQHFQIMLDIDARIDYRAYVAVVVVNTN